MKTRTPLELLDPGQLYDYLSRAETGAWVDEPTLQKRRGEARLLREQTVKIADTLKAQGIETYRSDGFFFWFYKIHSAELEELLPFCRSMMLPSVAASVRRPMLKALEYFLERNPFCRMWTFTSGGRVPVEGVRERVQYLHRKLSDLNAQPWMQKLGVEIVFRSTELGTPEFHSGKISPAKRHKEAARFGRIERGKDGEPLYHVHAHCMVHLKSGYIDPLLWSDLFHEIDKFWAHHWSGGERDKEGRANSIIRNAREVCKYVTKPAELLKLSGPQLSDLYRALRRLKLVQPLGTLAEEIRARKEKRLCLVKEHTSEGKVWREVRNFNASDGPRPVPGDEANKESNSRRDSVSVVARCLPSIGPAGVKEPGVIIRTRFKLTNDLLVRDHPMVVQIRERTREAYENGLQDRAAVISVHTCTSTVLTPFPTAPPRKKVERGGVGNRQFDDPARAKRRELLVAECSLS